MEDYDDLATGPDANGRLCLTFHNWEFIPSELYSYTSTLRLLDVSHNRLTDLPAEFGNLVMLRELNLSHNRLHQIDPITKLTRLRTLDLSHNSLTTIPKDLAQCFMLEALICNDNKIASIPDDIGNLFVLETLRLDNNELKYLPDSIAGIATIKEVNCKGNKDLLTVPLDMRDRTDMILWCLQLQCHYHDKLRRKTVAYNDVTIRVRRSVEKRVRAEETIEMCENELLPLRSLIRDSANYVRKKAEFVNVCKRVKKALNLLLRINCERKQSSRKP